MVLFCIPCLALLAYFGIASIFIPKYRVFLKEAWRCFLDKLMLRKCSVAFDERMRIVFSTWLAEKGFVRLGRFFYNKKNFDFVLISFVVIFTILSIYFIYLFIQFYINPPCAPTNNTTICLGNFSNK